MSRLAPLFLCLLPWGAAAQDGDAEYAVGRLELEAAWRLDPPEGRFDASGIERSPEGDLLVVRDAELAIYGIRFSPDSDVARLYRHPGYRLPDPLPDLGSRRFDVEGLAFDGEGTLYISDEYERRVLRIPSAGRIETLDLDLSQARRHFSPRDRNASLEGIAMGGGRLFLANERSKGRLFEFDPATGKMLHSFLCKPRENLWPDPHYSGLDWHDGKLYVLMRDAWLVVEMDPDKRTILRVLRYQDVERSEGNRYRASFPLAGSMEGILVEGDIVWLLTDNNGQPRLAAPEDTRPTLFRCRMRFGDGDAGP